MSEIKIIKEIDRRGTHGRYIARIDGVEGEGEITFTRQGEHVISADHTGVPKSMSGKGVAKALLNFMLNDAKSETFKIIPICPYIQAQYERHPEWSHLFTTKPGEIPRPTL